MKKQIFILVMAFFAISIGSTYGQAIHDSAPFVPATACSTDDALHPIAGKSYNYSAIIAPASSAGNYTWWATKDPNFITNQTTNNLTTKLAVGATAAITAASAASYGVSSSNASVDITWSSTILANTGYQGLATAAKTPTFVVVQFDGTGTTCANNLKVYEINPKNGFTVDIKNLNYTSYAPAAYGAIESQCIDKVSKATYVSPSMVYEYGTNIFYYEVIAANFSQEWTPAFVVTKANTVQTYTLQWTYSKPSTWATTPPTWNASTTKVTTNETITSSGVSIYVRLTMVNNNFEGLTLANNNVVLAVDGQDKDSQWDIKNSDCSEPKAADLDDTATQTLLPRPAITAGTTSATAPTTLISGNEQN